MVMLGNTQFRNHCKPNIANFRNSLQSIDWNNHVKTNQDLDNNMETFISIISSIYLESFPIVKKIIKPEDAKWMNSELRRE